MLGYDPGIFNAQFTGNGSELGSLEEFGGSCVAAGSEFIGYLASAAFLFEELSSRFFSTPLCFCRACWVFEDCLDDVRCADEALLISGNQFQQRAFLKRCGE